MNLVSRPASVWMERTLHAKTLWLVMDNIKLLALNKVLQVWIPTQYSKQNTWILNGFLKRSAGLWLSLFITVLELPCFRETIRNSPLNYSSVMITCGQVPSVPWYDPVGFNTMRSAPDVLLQIYLETWSLRWERPSTEEHIWHYNSMTSPFFFFFFWCFSPFSLSFYAYLLLSSLTFLR